MGTEIEKAPDAIGSGAMRTANAGEVAASAIAARARAEVEARYVIALRNPRNVDEVRLRVLADCKRPRFAESARYRKPVDGSKAVEGPSIRFAEAALRRMGNLDCGAQVTYEDDGKRIVRISCTDLETNATEAVEVVVEKTVERQKVPEGVQPISVRRNSSGRMTYLLPAREDELLNKVNAAISKARRNVILALVPADIVDEAMEQCVRTIEGEAQRDPAAARKRMVDAFFELGVMPTQLAEYLGHALETITSAEWREMSHVYTAIRDGETTWAATMAARAEAAAKSAPAEPKAEGEPQGRASAAATEIAEKAKALRAKKDAEKARGNTPPAGTAVPERAIDDSGELTPEEEAAMERDRAKGKP